MSKTQVLSMMIAAHVAKGMTIREAIDAVLGIDAFDALVADVYDTLRASAKS